MFLTRKRKFLKRIAYGSLKLSLLCCFIVFVILPLLFKYSVSLQRNILFLTFVSYPRDLDFKRPDKIDLYATRNFYVEVKDNSQAKPINLKVGVWHVLPTYVVKKFNERFHLNDQALAEINNATDISDPVLDRDESALKAEFPYINEQNEQAFFERMLRQPGTTIVLYLHGNTSSRGAPHRVDLYKLLRRLGYHVIAFDYRGYGDSDKVQPTEEGVILDSLAVYKYIRSLTKNPVFLWGHSLGTGVSTHLLSILQQMNVEQQPRAVVLESPFTSIRDEIRQHPFSTLFRNLPWFEHTISRPMYANSLRFESDKHINEFRQPVLILHAEDDIVVPFELGYRLYRIALDNRAKSWGPVEFHRFEATSRYGHKFLCRAPDLPEIISHFFNTYRNEIY
ncbi:unnamed protein product [Hermetia illucens]|uniref:AB hydrolase-1 domain-containing protein n=1 Tax=Hermetia illucens TaxID=343691 RepID=A0A7R8UY93_HERIL|nr:lysophosphatidylserine lipase ABHD12 isoform X3 [Hermetia illucens]CAD7088179.1 unnamed protein product [Hermetia illucens]